MTVLEPTKASIFFQSRSKLKRKENSLHMNITCKMWSYISVTIFWDSVWIQEQRMWCSWGNKARYCHNHMQKAGIVHTEKESCAEIVLVWTHGAIGVWDQENGIMHNKS
jgi:hypothetical protein